MAGQAVARARSVVGGKLVDQRRARLVHADHLHLGALSAEFQAGGVDRAYPGQVPYMRAADVDAHRFHRFLEFERLEEVLRRREEDLAFDDIGPLRAVRRQR